MRSIRLRRAAEADVIEAFLWYEESRPGLGGDFEAAVDEMVERIAESPQLYPVVYRDTRRALLKRFPYILYYYVAGEEIVVIACLHTRRDPRLLRRRRREA